jgi:RNA polymerase sigma-70 factor (ECF subfamily)
LLGPLVERAKRGDREAFDGLARLVGGTCMAIAVRILRDADQAEDAVQTALITAWRDLRTLRDSSRFEAWVHRILTRECYAEARRHVRRSMQVRTLRPLAADAGGVLDIDDRDQLERAFRRLTVEQRAVLVFHHYLGLSTAEVADRLDIPIGTVKSRIHHAAVAMRASLAADARTPSLSQERPA